MREFKVEVIPAIGPKNLEDLKEHLMRLRGIVRMVQLDVCDGIFVPSKTWPYGKDGDVMFKKIIAGDDGLPYWEDFDFEADLMVSNPSEVIEDWIIAGVSRVIVHEASISNKEELVHLISKIKSEGRVDIGLAISSETDLDTLDPYVSDLDFIQCMGIKRIGFSGEPFDQHILSTMESLRERYPELILSVDGGVSLDSAPYLINAGATRLATTSAIFKSNDIREMIDQLRGGIDFDSDEE